MRIKTIFIIIVTVLITVVIMQNADEVQFSLLFWKVYLSKLIVMAGLTLLGFFIGLLLGRPKKRIENIQPTLESPEFTPVPKTLSEEDRNYIN